MPVANPVSPQAAPRTSLAAIWSLVFGVLSFCLWFLGSIPALILGTVALVKINGSQGQLKGRGLAVAGLVTGGMGLFVGGILVALALPAMKGVKEGAMRSKQIHAIRALVVACESYAEDNGGKYPRVLRDLIPDYIEDESMLKFINKETQQLEPYLYFSGKTLSSEPRSLLIASPVVQRHRRVVGFCDTSVSQVEDEEFYRLAELESEGQ